MFIVRSRRAGRFIARPLNTALDDYSSKSRGVLAPMVIAVVAVLVSASLISFLAFVSAKRRARVFFVGSVALCWVAFGFALGYHSSSSALVPDRIPLWRDVVASLILTLPFALVPAAFTLPVVFGTVTLRRIPVLAIAGAITALPFAFIALIPTACYVIRDCL